MVRDLTEEQRTFVVRRLAKFYFPDEIIAEFSSLWQPLRLDIADVYAHDPNKGLCDDKLIAIFNAVRAEFIASGNASPAANDEVQLAELQAIYQRERGRNASASVLQGLLAQINVVAAKRAGNGTSDTPEIARFTRTVIYPAKPDIAA